MRTDISIYKIFLLTFVLLSCNDDKTAMDKKEKSDSNIVNTNLTEKIDLTQTKINLLDNIPYVADGDGIKTARFYGGKKAFEKFINANKKEIKSSKRDFVTIGFAVDTAGSLFGFKISFPIENCEECNQEALRLAKLMPKWLPAYHIDEKGLKIDSFISAQSIKVYF